MTEPQHDFLCIGAINVDRKYRLHGPFRPGSSNPATLLTSRAGGVARNVAENLARMGRSTALLAIAGGDAAGRELLAQARAAGIDTRACRRAARGSASSSYTALLDAAGQMLWALADMALYEPPLTRAALARVGRAVAAARRVCADLNWPRATLAQVQAACRHAGRPLALVAVSEAKMEHLPQDLNGVDVLLLNAGELLATSRADGSSPAGLDQAWRALAARGLGHIVITSGAGAVWWGQASQGLALSKVVVPGLPAELLRDVTGAGDAFCAAFLEARYCRGLAMAASCMAGNERARQTLQTTATVWDGREPDTSTRASP
jgi:pseudouridine kinase